MKATDLKSTSMNESSSNKPMGDIGDTSSGRDALSSAKGYVEGMASDYSKKMQAGFESAKERFRTTSSDVNQWVQKNPLAAVGIALGAGLVIGKLFVSNKRE